MTAPTSRRQAARVAARALAAEHRARGDALGWFERLYGAGDGAAIPWFDGQANALLAGWPGLASLVPGTSALVVGCGLGDDAELLASLGADVTAFDLAASAVDWCRRRFPGTRVHYQVADLLDPPPAWRRAFDLVVEIYTLQALPADVRQRALEPLASLVAPSGRLLVVTRIREEHDPSGELPYPLTPSELLSLQRGGLRLEQLEELPDDHDTCPRRVRALFRRGLGAPDPGR